MELESEIKESFDFGDKDFTVAFRWTIPNKIDKDKIDAFVDYFAMYNRALSQKEIREIYQGSFQVCIIKNRKGLVLYLNGWKVPWLALRFNSLFRLWQWRIERKMRNCIG